MNVKRFFKCLFIDPLGVREEINKMNSRAAEFQGDLYHSTKRLEELIKAFHGFDERMQQQMFLEQVNKSLHYSVPDMFWVKDTEGKYLKANDAIRRKLLFCDDPIGKTDRELASKIHEVISEDRHTFGAICGNSDKEVLKQDCPMKFNEDGLVNGEYMMLQVHKNVVRDTRGNVIGVVGVGRDITYEVGMLNKAINTTSCEDTKEILKEIIDHYRFTDRS